MNRQVRPPSSTSSSTGSTVVPATSSTTTRSSPASLLSSEDLPTLGLPTIATRRGPPTSASRLRRRLGQRGEDGVEQVAGPAAVQRGDRVRLAQPEVPQRRRPRPRCAGRRPCWRPARPACRDSPQDLDDGLVVVGDADGRVDDEQHRVGEADRDLGLAGDPLGQAAGVGVPAAGVDDGEGAAGPVGVVGDPVAGDAGHVLDDGLAAADDPVDQRGLADVGAADDGEDRDGPVAAPRAARASVGWSLMMLLGRYPVSGSSSLSSAGRRAGQVAAGQVLRAASRWSQRSLLEQRRGLLDHFLACAARAARRVRRRRRPGRRGCRAAGARRLPPPGSGCRTWTTGTTARRSPARGRPHPRWKRSSSPRPARPSGKIPTARSVAQHPQAGLHGARVGVEPVERDLPGAAQEPPSPALEHLLLGQRVHRPRRADRQQRPVDDADVVGREDHRARGRHLLGAVDSRTR